MAFFRKFSIDLSSASLCGRQVAPLMAGDMSCGGEAGPSSTSMSVAVLRLQLGGRLDHPGLLHRGGQAVLAAANLAN